MANRNENEIAPFIGDIRCEGGSSVKLLIMYVHNTQTT